MYIYKQGGGLCIVGCSDLPPRPLTHYLPSYFTIIHPSNNSIIVSSYFTIICTIVCTNKKFHQENPSKEIHFCTIKFSIKKIHQRKSIFALSSFPSRKSIKGNPFLHYQVFHQENPSKEIHFCTIKFSIKKIHHLHYQIFHHIIIILFHQFFSSPLRGIINGR